jgi:hypothetical protein
MPISAASMEDALTSMLRTDYIPLKDTEKLARLREYYVDYMGYVSQILGEVDQLIVGRRGTGKTTLLYRALVECMRSWTSEGDCLAKPKTLGIYMDLNKCQSLAEVSSEEFREFEHVFITELCEVIREELNRSWPELSKDPGFFSRLFRSAESRKVAEVRKLTADLAKVLSTGIPRLAERASPQKVKTLQKTSKTENTTAKVSASATSPNLSAEAGSSASDATEYESTYEELVHYRLTVADILRLLGAIREAAGLSHIIIFIDEFSALSSDLQRRFTTLLKRIIGNHQGIFVKLCAITDNYSLGSSIILQRDLFELPLDLDAYVERSGSLNAAMVGLADLTRKIVEQRFAAYIDATAEEVFEEQEDAWRELGRAAMGVPRTLGIVLKHAWTRSTNSRRRKISRSDLEHGIRTASKAYYKQLEGASKDGLAVPRYVFEIWNALIQRAVSEKSKVSSAASHFMVLVTNQERLKYLSTFFLVHLLTDGRTTKKDKSPRTLYCFDYGICLENNLEFSEDKNIIRQQRFAYDSVLKAFDRYFSEQEDKRLICTRCGMVYLEKDLFVGGHRLTFCPADKTDLKEMESDASNAEYTEEEIRIIGTIRSATPQDQLVARAIADDVGCYVQKVGKFAEKLDRSDIIDREKLPNGRYIYFERTRDHLHL